MPFLPPQRDALLQERLLSGNNLNSQGPFARVGADTGTELARQWANPSIVVATVLMFVGGNAVQEALAQSTGALFTPVCFSFGWIGYTLATIKDVFGEGRLLPPPDYPVKVFNVASGYYRVNKNWLIGRILRDHESWIGKFEPLGNGGIRIAIFEAMTVAPRRTLTLKCNTRHLLGAVVMFIQLIIAAVPTVQTRGHEWGIVAVTAVGTVLAMLMGVLPQWWAEKMPNRRDSKKVFALTAGNGSRDIMIIKGEGRCLDLEELATLDSPRTARPWTKMERFSRQRSESWGREAKTVFGRPVGFVITRSVCIFEVVAWLLILISLAGIQRHTWYFVGVGAIGLIHNSILANLRREPKARGLPLKLLDTISTSKVMDGLMDLEETHEGCGVALLQEFFPGRLRPDEEDWWNRERGQRANTSYDQKRLKDHVRRLWPRSMLPKYNLHTLSGSTDTETPATMPDRGMLPAATTPPGPGRKLLEAVTNQQNNQSEAGFGNQLYQNRTAQGAAAVAKRRPETLTRGSGLCPPPTGVTSSSALGTPGHQGGGASDHRRQDIPSVADSTAPAEELAKKMPKRPYWD
ncbi:hypothetical protein O9K51_10808 [Purpureocillium lavendulum]|uniref:Uncharacterized protein n=1 Tax=Purpureocillium lavendulum TaxID=1247861 RepID=A0AB34FBF2_9HYPO|nr:hypothetical protein O9K51_10808 [Purpureocillium lavendulum]